MIEQAGRSLFLSFNGFKHPLSRYDGDTFEVNLDYTSIRMKALLTSTANAQGSIDRCSMPMGKESGTKEVVFTKHCSRIFMKGVM